MITNDNFKKSRFLVTGGKGFLGSNVIKELILKGVPNKNILSFNSKEHDLRKMRECKNNNNNNDTFRILYLFIH